ncbi:MAG: sugar O-acyltransferase [bacterium]|nr:sugar O-acyltransferase [bacterium]
MQKLVLMGITGNNADILDAVREINAIKPTFNLLGYLTRDGHPQQPGGLSCLGDFASARTFPSDVQVAGFAFSTATFRQWPDIVASLGLPDERFATIVHPRAYVSPQSTIGHGSILLAGVTVGAFATVGNHVIILQNVALSHDDVIGDYTCITVGASFSGNVQVGRNCYIGTNATVVCKQIGEGSLVGTGALVRHNIPPNEIWVGNPAQFLRNVITP